MAWRLTVALGGICTVESTLNPNLANPLLWQRYIYIHTPLDGDAPVWSGYADDDHLVVRYGVCMSTRLVDATVSTNAYLF